MQVGVRELKAKLSEHLSRVADGERITVTDRGKPVAEIVPLDGVSNVERGIEAGWIEPASAIRLQPAEPVAGLEPIMSALDEDRG